MKTTLLSAAFTLVTLGLCSAQDGLNQTYNFFDFGYENTNFRGELGDVLKDGDGFAVDLMLSPVQHLLLVTDYHYSKPNNIENDSVTTHDLKLGVGGYLPLGSAASIYTHLGGRYLQARTGIDGFNPDEWGFYVEPGIRVNLGEKLEIYGAAEYTRIVDLNMVNGKAGGVFYFTPQFGLELFGRFGGDWANQYGAGVRFAW